ncbi:MAG: HEAT repeat domain-containing protein [Candidatus Riflebacteria bacterium]|nr:HEAT repeat domain-containing protein [Candidatus Riflebacteria bacterium]
MNNGENSMLTSEFLQSSWDDFTESLFSSLPALREMAVLELPAWAESGKTITDVLAKSLQDDSSAVARAAAVVAGRMGTPDPEIINIFESRLDDQDDLFRRTMVTALARMGSPAIPLLIKMLNDRDLFIRQYASMTLEQLSEKSVPELVKMLSFANQRRQVSDVLIRIGGIAEPELLKGMENAGSDTRFAIMEILEKIGPSTLPKLLEFLGDTDSSKRAIEETCGKIEADSVPHLMNLLREEAVETRCIAAAALVRVGKPAVKPLITALSDTNASIAWVAAHALVQIGVPALPEIITALENSDNSLKWMIADIMIKIGEHSIPHLVSGLKNSDNIVRQISVHALGELGSVSPAILGHLQTVFQNEKSEDVKGLMKIVIEKLSANR